MTGPYAAGLSDPPARRDAVKGEPFDAADLLNQQTGVTVNPVGA